MGKQLLHLSTTYTTTRTAHPLIGHKVTDNKVEGRRERQLLVSHMTDEASGEANGDISLLSWFSWESSQPRIAGEEGTKRLTGN